MGYKAGAHSAPDYSIYYYLMWERHMVIAGIVNHERKEVSCRVEVMISGKKNIEVGQLVLIDEQKWEGEAGFIPAIWVGFTFIISLYFSCVVKATKSILGVALAHGICNITVYLEIPFF